MTDFVRLQIKTDGNVDSFANVGEGDDSVPIPVKNDEQTTILEDIKDALPSKNSGGALIISTTQNKFRDEFFNYDTTDKWYEKQVGSGMAISLAGDSGGARYLNINTGVTNGAETILLSRIPLSTPFKVSVGVSLSQRIVNQLFAIEIVEIDENGEVVTENSLFTNPYGNDAKNWAAIIFDGTTAANERIGVRAEGLSPDVPVSAAFGTSAATGTTPNFIQAFNFEITINSEMVAFQANAINSTTAGTVIKRTNVVPNPDKQYALRIRAKNTGVTASATDFRIHIVRVLDASRVSVDFGIIGGRIDAQAALPVALTSQTMTVSSTTLLPSATVGGTTSTHHRISTNDTNLVNVKNSAGSVTSIEISNFDTVPVFFKLYNKASAPVLASDTPIKTIMIPAGQTIILDKTIYYRLSSGISFALTGGITDTDTTAVAENKTVINISYI